MDCDSIRAAISASLDGESTEVGSDDIIASHLEACGACEAWRDRAHELTRRARLGGYALDHDLAPRVLAALPANPPATMTTPKTTPKRRVWPRVALAALAVAQFAITVPLLILGHDQGAGTHAAHELGSFDLALAIAFIVGAVRPRLSGGLAWPCCIAALGLAGTAVADLIVRATFGVDEAQHLVAVAGALLLLWQARTADARGSGGATLDTDGSGDPTAGDMPGDPGDLGGPWAGPSDSDTPGSPWDTGLAGDPAAARRKDAA